MVPRDFGLKMGMQSDLQQDELADCPDSGVGSNSIRDFDSLVQRKIDDGGLVQFLLFLMPGTVSMLNRFRREGSGFIESRWVIFGDPLRPFLLYLLVREEDSVLAKRALRMLLRSSIFWASVVLLFIVFRFGSQLVGN